MKIKFWNKIKNEYAEKEESDTLRMGLNGLAEKLRMEFDHYHSETHIQSEKRTVVKQIYCPCPDSNKVLFVWWEQVDDIYEIHFVSEISGETFRDSSKEWLEECEKRREAQEKLKQYLILTKCGEHNG